MFSPIEVLAWLIAFIIMVIIALVVEYHLEPRHHRKELARQDARMRELEAVTKAQPGELVMVGKDVTPADIELARMMAMGHIQAGFIRLRFVFAIAACAAINFICHKLSGLGHPFIMGWAGGIVGMVVAAAIFALADHVDAMDRKAVEHRQAQRKASLALPPLPARQEQGNPCNCSFCRAGAPHPPPPPPARQVRQDRRPTDLGAVDCRSPDPALWCDGCKCGGVQP